MPILTKAQLEALNQASFPDNSSEAITPEILREYNTATIDTLVDSLDTGSFATSAVTGSSLITASFDNGTRNLTFTKGNSTQFSVNIPDVSGSSGNFATTGSNIFVGDQTITGSLNVSSSVSSIIKVPNPGFLQNGLTVQGNFGVDGDVYFNGGFRAATVYTSTLGAFQGNTINMTAGVTRWDTQVPGETAQVVITGSLALSGSLSASLQQGNVWVGGSTGFSTLQVPTSSFAGLAPVGIATTGSNTFTGLNTFNAGVLIPSASTQVFYGNDNALAFFDAYVLQGQPGRLNIRRSGVGAASGSAVHIQNSNLIVSGALTASLQEGYALVGNGSGQTQAVPTSSFAGATQVGVATTGSNIFVGDQTITGSVNLSGGEHLFIRRSTTGAVQDLRLGATDNGNNFAFIVTGSDTNPGQQVWGINTAGGIWNNSFDGGVVFNNFVTASAGLRIQNSGTFSAPLTQGNVWVGDANGRTSLIPTSSFGGGGTINTGSFATTGSNVFNGGQTILNGGIDLQSNVEGSGSSFTSITSRVDTTSDPTNVYSALQLVKPNGDSLIGMAVNSYSPQYGTATPMILADGNNPDGNNTAMGFTANGEMDVWKKSNFKYGVDVTGSVSVKGLSSQTFTAPADNTQKDIITVTGVNTSGKPYNLVNFSFQDYGGSGANYDDSFAFECYDGFGYNYGSELTINGQRIDFGLIASGSGRVGRFSMRDQYNGTTFSNLYADEIQIGEFAAGTNNRIGIGHTALPILELKGQAVRITGGLIASGSTTITGGLIASGSTTITGSLSQVSGNTSLQGNLNVSGAFVTFNSPGGDTLTLQGGGLRSAGTITGNNNLNLISDGSGITLAKNSAGSGSQYSSIANILSTTETPTDIYGGYLLNSSGNNQLAAFVVNSYSPQYSGTPTAMIIGTGNNPDGSDTAIAFPSSGQTDHWRKSNFKYEATFTTGSNKQAGTAVLSSGTVTVSNSLVTANSIIMLTKQTFTNNHFVGISSKGSGTFTIDSSNNSDTDAVGWFIINNS